MVFDRLLSCSRSSDQMGSNSLKILRWTDGWDYGAASPESSQERGLELAFGQVVDAVNKASRAALSKRDWVSVGISLE